MDVRALGYIGIAVADLEAWRGYAELLGTMVLPGDGDDGLRLKIDDRPHRVFVQRSDAGEGLAFAGWELADAAALAQAAAELEAAGHACEPGTADELAARRVRGLVRSTDPGGFRVELFWGPIHDHQLFVSPTGVTGFV